MTGRLVRGRRLVCVYFTAPHSCVLSEGNRRRPHPSGKKSLLCSSPPQLPPPSLAPSLPLVSSPYHPPPPPPLPLYFVVQVRPLQKCQLTGRRSRHGVSAVNHRVSSAFLSFQVAVCVSQGEPLPASWLSTGEGPWGSEGRV